MAPSRKSRSVNKWFANEVSPHKLTESADQSKEKKRKFSKQLGPRWTKQELERFYQAYRKHGKDWKKVASMVRNRSTEMVEALYLMNKAYLSLPDGAASVVGLVAMMIDHYDVLVGSDSDREGNEGGGSRPKKRAKKHHASKGSDKHFSDSPSQRVGSSDGYLSLLNKKRPGSLPRVVRKRTPRVPLSHLERDKEKFSWPDLHKLKPRMDADDDEVAHDIAMALTSASQRSDSPKVSQLANRKEAASPSPLQHGGRMGTEAQMTTSKICITSSRGRKLKLRWKNNSKEFLADKSYSSGRISVEFRGKGKGRYVKRQEVENGANDHLDDSREAAKNAKNKRKLSAAKRKNQTEIVDGKSKRILSKGSRKKSRKSLFGDEDYPFDALQTLADMSVMMRATTDVNESESAEGKEENYDGASGYKLKEKDAASVDEEPASRSSEQENATAGIQKSAIRVQRKKKNSPLKLQVHEKESLANPHPIDKKKTEVTCKKKGSFYTGQRSPHNSHIPPEKLLNSHGFTYSGSNSKKKMNDLVDSTTEVPSKEARTAGKMDIHKTLVTADTKTALHCSEQKIKESLSNCLSRGLARRWCTFEWFYSAIDYPWFARSEFVEYLHHVTLDHVPRLTRCEWNVIKGSLGRPRRFSERFLKEEREKLNQYRESVRTHYAELRSGTREGLPTDLARPPSKGQQVIAIHPKTRQLCNGTVIAVEHSWYRVQFDMPDLGVERVMDIECMPLNPTENLPVSLRKHNLNEAQTNEQLLERKTNKPVRVAPTENLVNAQSHSIFPSIHDIDELLRCNESPIASQVGTKEADVQAVSELFRALDKKEAVVIELRYMNEAMVNEEDGDNPLKDSEAFKKHHASVVLLLNEVNEQVSSAILSLRERNTYQKTDQPKKNPVTKLNDRNGLPRSVTHVTSLNPYIYKEIEPQVDKIVGSSRIRAQKVVGLAVQAISTLEKMGEMWESTGEAIDFVNDHLSDADFDVPAVIRKPLKASSEQLHLGASTPLANTTHTVDPNSKPHSDQDETKIPSELIAHCVATLLMIQKCTERQFPPSEVAQVLDQAVTSLHPLCSKSLSVYEEIQKYMGIIRTQILALIPS